MRLHSTGRVVCPPDKGGWSGQLAWRNHPEPGYWLEYDPKEYDARRIAPRPVKVYFDLGQLTQAIAFRKQEIAELQAHVERLTPLLQMGVVA